MSTNQKQNTSEEKRDFGHATRNTIKSLCAGGIAGAVSRTITSPLERLKVMRQVQSAGSTKYDSLLGSLIKMYHDEGLSSYWKGNGTNVVRIAPHSAIQFFCFDVYRRFLIPDDAQHTVLTLAAGGLAGATASMICYPLDLVRSVLTVQTTEKQYDGIANTIKFIVNRDGINGLYRGLPATLAGIAPYVAINFTVFDTLKRRYLPDKHHPYFNTTNLLLGACAGFTAATMTYPTDLIRRRMQLQGVTIAGIDIPKYNGMIDCAVCIFKEEGMRGLYKGLTPCLLKVVPSMAIAFMTYEYLRKHWNFQPPSAKSISVS